MYGLDGLDLDAARGVAGPCACAYTPPARLDAAGLGALWLSPSQRALAHCTPRDFATATLSARSMNGINGKAQPLPEVDPDSRARRMVIPATISVAAFPRPTMNTQPHFVPANHLNPCTGIVYFEPPSSRPKLDVR